MCKKFIVNLACNECRNRTVFSTIIRGESRVSSQPCLTKFSHSNSGQIWVGSRIGLGQKGSDSCTWSLECLVAEMSILKVSPSVQGGWFFC